MRNIRNILFLMVVPFSQIVRNMVIVFLLSKFLPLTDVGLWGQVLAVHGFLYLFLNLNLTHSMARFYPAKKDNRHFMSGDFWAISVVIVGLSVVVLMIFVFSNKFLAKILFKSSEYGWVVNMLGIFVVLENIFNNIFSFYRGIQMHGTQSLIVLLRAFLEFFIVGGGIYYFAYISSLDLNIVFHLYFTSLAIVVIVAYLWAVAKGYLIITKPNFGFLVNHLKYGLPQLPASLSNWMINLADRMIITVFLGLQTLGVYFIANRIAMLLFYPFGPVSQVVFTEGSRRYDKGYDISALKKKIIYYYMLLMVGGALIFYLALPYIVPFFLKESPYEVMKIVPALFVSVIMLSLFSIKTLYLGIEKRSKYVGLLWSMVAIINVVVSLFLTPRMGTIGTILAAVCAYAVGLIWITINK